MTAVDEAQKELDVGDEAADRHRAGEDALTALPDDQEDTSDHDGRVNRLETSLQARETEISFDEFFGPSGHMLDRCARSAEQAQYPHAGEMFVDG